MDRTARRIWIRLGIRSYPKSWSVLGLFEISAIWISRPIGSQSSFRSSNLVSIISVQWLTLRGDWFLPAAAYHRWPPGQASHMQRPLTRYWVDSHLDATICISPLCMLARAARSRTTPARPARNGIHYRFREARPGGAICICMSKFFVCHRNLYQSFYCHPKFGLPFIAINSNLPILLLSYKIWASLHCHQF